MIETREPTNGQVVKQHTPATITTTMIINDLENGIDRAGILEKYNLEVWEVKQMFMHPALKGKKAKKIRKLSFNFVDDISDIDNDQVAADRGKAFKQIFVAAKEALDPNQTSIEDTGYDSETMQITAKVETIDGTVIEEIDFEQEEDTDIEY